MGCQSGADRRNQLPGRSGDDLLAVDFEMHQRFRPERLDRGYDTGKLDHRPHTGWPDREVLWSQPDLDGNVADATDKLIGDGDA